MAAAFAAIGGKWKLTLVHWLAHGESHFAHLRRTHDKPAASEAMGCASPVA